MWDSLPLAGRPIFAVIVQHKPEKLEAVANYGGQRVGSVSGSAYAGDQAYVAMPLHGVH